MKAFKEIKHQPHDASGIDDPRNFAWKKGKLGVWYPVTEDAETHLVKVILKAHKKENVNLIYKENIDLSETGPFKGFVVKGSYWNGWLQPYFTKRQAEKLAEALEYFEMKDGNLVDNYYKMEHGEEATIWEPDEYGLVTTSGYCWDADDMY